MTDSAEAAAKSATSNSIRCCGGRTTGYPDIRFEADVQYGDDDMKAPTHISSGSPLSYSVRNRSQTEATMETTRRTLHETLAATERENKTAVPALTVRTTIANSAANFACARLCQARAPTLTTGDAQMTRLPFIHVRSSLGASRRGARVIERECKNCATRRRRRPTPLFERAHRPLRRRARPPTTQQPFPSLVESVFWKQNRRVQKS